MSAESGATPARDDMGAVLKASLVSSSPMVLDQFAADALRSLLDPERASGDEGVMRHPLRTIVLA